MLRQQLISLRKLGGIRPNDRKRTEEFFELFGLRPIPTTDEQFHGDDAGNSKDLGRRSFEPCLRRRGASKTIDQHIRVNEHHLGGALPAFGTESASELNAVCNV